jgi:hypothetical protein
LLFTNEAYVAIMMKLVGVLLEIEMVVANSDSQLDLDETNIKS